jgi:glutamate formiminotransferase/formiminotetrahydrofolate cyclodeaminase
VGARFPLIAYNIYLNSADIKVAQAIAQVVRFAGGGLRFVKALGFEIKERNQVQVSMNLTNYESTPIFHAFEMVEMEAKRHGVSIASSEIVGLVPQKALDACAGHYLCLEDFASSQILENRLAQTMISGPFLSDFVAEVALPEAIPGGGSVAALTGALGAALGEMVAGLTEGHRTDPAAELPIQQVRTRLYEARRGLYDLIEGDSSAYQALINAITLPEGTGKDLELRPEVVESAAQGAIEVPLATARAAYGALECLVQLLRIGKSPEQADAAAGAQLAYAALKAAQYNILANIPLIKDGDFVERSRAEVSRLVENAQALIIQADQMGLEVR